MLSAKWWWKSSLEINLHLATRLWCGRYVFCACRAGSLSIWLTTLCPAWWPTTLSTCGDAWKTWPQGRKLSRCSSCGHAQEESKPYPWTVVIVCCQECVVAVTTQHLWHGYGNSNGGNDSACSLHCHGNPGSVYCGGIRNETTDCILSFEYLFCQKCWQHSVSHVTRIPYITAHMLSSL